MQQRENALSNWLETVLKTTNFDITLLTGDASFRRYYRLHYHGLTRIIMDAPPDKEAIEPFITVAKLLSNQAIHAPTIYAADKTLGFMLLEDFGDTLLLQALNSVNSNELYTLAMDTLLKMQNCSLPSANELPYFNKKYMISECNLFIDWFLQKYLSLQLSQSEEELIRRTIDKLCDAIMAQPQVFIHRDYHSRNIMLISNFPGEKELGILDFQDAMYGPYTYDLVSLLKDCYIQWPREQIIAWLAYFYKHSPLAQQNNIVDFACAFDYCGLQRHLKVLGIFSRLFLRDNKANYLKDLPLTLNYLMACLEHYQEFSDFYDWMQQKVHLP